MYRKFLLPIVGAAIAAVALVSATSVLAAAPSPNGNVFISGKTYDAGLTLTATVPSYTTTPDSITFEWSRCDLASPAPPTCTPIAGATSGTYTTAADDLGHHVQVAVTATNTDGSTTSTSMTGLAIGAPNVFVAPVLSNNVDKVGDSVSVSTGSWNVPSGHSPTYSYQWVECPSNGPDTGCSGSTPISGATSNSYTVTTGDMGHVIGVFVTATNDYGSNGQIAWTGYKIGNPQVGGASPSFTGHASDVGEVVTATDGEWRSPDGSAITFSYQWQRCTTTSSTSCSDIVGETASSYTAVSADLGKRLAVNVIATNATGSTTNHVALFYVVGGPWLDMNDVSTIGGVGHPGETLTASEGTWYYAAGHDPTYTYAWYTCNSQFIGPDTICTPISGETGRTYVVKDADVGNAIYLVVTATNDYGHGGWFTDDGIYITQPSSPATAPPPPPPAAPQPQSSSTQTVQPSDSSSVTLVPPPGLAAAPATVAWSPSTFGDAPATVTATAEVPQASQGVEFAAGSAVIQIEATDMAGTPITSLGNVLDISVPNAPAGITPVYQRGNDPWVVIPPLASGTTLAQDQSDGWYRDGTTLHILTRHLTKFALAKALEVKWGVRRTVSLRWAKSLPVYLGPSVDATAAYVLRRGTRVVGSWSASLPAGTTAPTRLGLRSKAIVPGDYRLTIVVKSGPQHWAQVVALHLTR